MEKRAANKLSTYYFKGLLQNTGWVEDQAISVNKDGIITKIFPFDSADNTTKDKGNYGIPGFQNAHSHAFQFAMSGIAESHKKGADADDFWSWREMMYRLALSLNPDQLESIATLLYTKMARLGYTNVAEFHYLHHDKNGKAYNNLAEMGSSLVSAAQKAGIGITLVPIFYQKGGFNKDPQERQKRFISADLDSYFKLLEASERVCGYYEHANMGMGAHSLRAVTNTDILRLVKEGPKHLPFHIHVSEQLKEVEESITFLGKRPVRWMLDNIDMNDRFHLVHATHLDDEEICDLAQSKANVVLCPSTEGNLGDGLFALKEFQDHGGSWSIGTDSHIGLNPLEELRILDYGQRVSSHKRNIFTSAGSLDSGRFAIEMITNSGRKAMNNKNSLFFEIGKPLNACIIDGDSSLIACSSLENLSSTIVYSGHETLQVGVISNGKLIKNKKIDPDIIQGFSNTIGELALR